MRFFRDLPISRKLVLLALLTSSVALALSSLGYALYSESQYRAQLKSSTDTLADITAYNCAAAVSMVKAMGDTGDAEKVLQSLEKKPAVTWAAVYLKDDKVLNGKLLLARYKRKDVDPSSIPSAPPPASTFLPNAYRAIHIIGSDKDPDGTLVIESDLSELWHERRTGLAVTGMIFIVSSLLAALIAFRLQRLISRPIMSLAQTAREVTQHHNYSLRARKIADDETGFLIDSFNVMLDQIEVANAELAIARDHALEASSAKSSFLANMSHEIRTPMNGIIGLTRLALQSELTPVQREYLTMVSRSADALLQILNDILDFSKIEAGMLDFDPHPFSIRELTSTVAKLMAVRAHEKGLELIAEVDPRVRPTVISDSTRLQQVLLNLVGNSVKFTDKGEIVIKVVLEEDLGDEQVLHLMVSDTGIGIPQDKIKTIFQAFSQADVSTTRKYGGTGLGLSITTKLVHMMGGKIWAESEPGKGSIFHFTLKAGVSEEAPVEASAEPLRGLHLLVVDDNATNLRVMIDLLRGWEAIPTAAKSGPEALEEMKLAVRNGKPFDLVLLDMHMPEMDGFELAHEIHVDEKLSASVVMMLNSSNLKGDAERARSEGIVATMTKPVSETELLRAIATHLRGRGEKRSAVPAAAASTAAPKMSSLRILLAEDNKVNQTLATITLEQMGHTVRVAENGRQAIELYGQEMFDLILMDLQMPDMDGFQAVAAIRESEQGGERRVPIIALTAHALKGDRERCLASGMTGYVSKPLDPDKLALEIALVTGASMQEEAPPEAAAEPEPVPASKVEIDQVAFLKRCANNWPLAQTLIQQFRDTRGQMEGDLRQAAEAGDATALGRAAHALKGVVSVFGAESMVTLARELEESSKAGEVDKGKADQLLADCEALVGVLGELKAP